MTGDRITSLLVFLLKIKLFNVFLVSLELLEYFVNFRYK